MSIITVNSLVNRVKQRLNALTLDDLGALHVGDGVTTDPITSDNGIVLALNNAKNARCRQVFALSGTFTASWVAGQYWAYLDGTGSGPVFAPVTGGIAPVTDTAAALWWPRMLTFGSTVLRFCDEAAARYNDPAYQVTPTATISMGVFADPAFWYRRGTQGLGLVPVPAGTGTVMAEGFLVPGDMAAGGNVTWIEPSRAQLLVDDAALEIVAKNITDAQILAHTGAVQSEADALAMEFWLELPPSLRQPGGPFSVPPRSLKEMKS